MTDQISDNIPNDPSAPSVFVPEDIVAAVLIIDAACDAGAFKGWEDIQKVFTVRNRLVAFADQWSNTIKADKPNNEGEK